MSNGIHTYLHNMFIHGCLENGFKNLKGVKQNSVKEGDL